MITLRLAILWTSFLMISRRLVDSKRLPSSN